MDINLELYKVFYYVATTLSFSEASRQLFISQSAVSQSIKTLEKKLNHPLFINNLSGGNAKLFFNVFRRVRLKFINAFDRDLHRCLIRR